MLGRTTGNSNTKKRARDNTLFGLDIIILDGHKTAQELFDQVLAILRAFDQPDANIDHASFVKQWNTSVQTLYNDLFQEEES